MIDYIRDLVTLDDEIAELQGRLDDLKTRRAEVEKTLIDIWADQNAGIESIRYNGRSVTMVRRLWARVKAGCMDDFEGSAFGYLVGRTVNVNTLSALVREYEKAGMELPEDLREVISVAEVFKIRT